MKNTIEVCLNGTTGNPWHKMGLKQNPFPQTAKAELNGACLRLQSLGGDPIPCGNYENYIREKLRDFSEEFITGCIKRFVPGQYIRFTVEWDD